MKTEMREKLQQRIHKILEIIYDDHSVNDENIAVLEIMKEVDEYVSEKVIDIHTDC